METTKPKIDIARLIRTIRDLAKRNPDKRNPWAQLFDVDGKPVCIAGHALAEQGIVEHLYGYVRTMASCKYEPINCNPGDLEWIWACQNKADEGSGKDSGPTWADAVRHADLYYPR